VEVTFEGGDNSEPVYAVSLVSDTVPRGTAFLAVTMRLAGTNPAVRQARYIIETGQGGRKTVPVRVEPAPNVSISPAHELQPAATANVLQPGTQPL
jgi:hypothetical protein